MSELLLREEAQVFLSERLYDHGLFGIAENPKDYKDLKSGRRSPHYLDIRPGMSSVPARENIVDILVELLGEAASRKLNKGFSKVNISQVYDHIAGVPEAMTSYATLIGDDLYMSLLQPRVFTDKVSGNKTPIMGQYKPGDRVTLFDDAITDGESILNANKVFYQEALVVEDNFVILDREEGGAPKIAEKAGICVKPALALSGLVKVLYCEGKINQIQYDNVAEYMQQYGEPQAQSAF